MSQVCTLFENDYHRGVAALTNSLCGNGFSGTVWAGYRGALPPWASSAKQHEQGFYELNVDSGTRICFLPIQTEVHLTNYKPQFMLMLLDRFCPEAKNIFYFDPDIVIKCRWSFFEEWVSCGISLCEDMISPVYQNHPLRTMWKTFYEPHGCKFVQSHDVYVNGGFVGLEKSKKDFLEQWSEMQALMPVDAQFLKTSEDRTNPFQRFDQDVLNAAICCTAHPLSIVGKEGMDFNPYGEIMSHAIGKPKPWNKPFVLQALRGRSPSLADRNYLKYSAGPITAVPLAILLAKKLDLQIAAAIGRVIRRSL